MRQVKKIRPIVENQIDLMRQAGFREETIIQRLKGIGMPNAKMKELGLPVPEPKAQRQEEELGSIEDFMQDVSNFLEYAHRELLPIKSRYPDAVANLMSWHRKINQRLSQMRPKA